MWVILTEGYFSASAIPGAEDGDIIQIRARVRVDLENLLSHLDSAEQVMFTTKVTGNQLTLSIDPTPQCDYEYRVYMTKEQWGQYLAWSASQIDYAKFKPAVEANPTQGKDRHQTYIRVWDVLLDDLGSPDNSWKKPFMPANDYNNCWDVDEWQGPLNPAWNEPTDEELGAIASIESRSISRSAKKRARRKANKRAKSAEAY